MTQKAQIKSAIKVLSLFLLFPLNSCNKNFEVKNTIEFDKEYENISLSAVYGSVSLEEDSSISKPKIIYDYKFKGDFDKDKTYISSEIKEYEFDTFVGNFDYATCTISLNQQNEIQQQNITINYNPSITKRIYIKTEYGVANLSTKTSLEYLEVENTVGRINFSSGTIKYSKFATEQGDLTINGNFDTISTFVTTGNINLTNNSEASYIQCETQTGNIDAKFVPASNGTNVYYSVSNGNVTSDTYKNEITQGEGDFYINKTSSIPSLYEFLIVKAGDLSFNKVN